MTPFARILKLSAAFLASNLARAAIGFGLALVLARGLGAERFGRWILCTTWASTLTVVADLGFGVLLTRDGARPDARDGGARRQVIAALTLRLALAVPLGIAMFAAASRLGVDAESIAGVRVAALLGIMGAAYSCFGAMFRSQPLWLPTVLGIETAWMAAQLVGSAWLVRRGFGVVALMGLAVGVQMAQLLCAEALWRPAFGVRGRVMLSIRDLVATMRRALPFAASGLVANLETRVAPLMLGYLAMPAALGMFAAAARFGRVARLAPQAIFAGALPVLSHEHARDPADARHAFRTFNRAVLLFATAAGSICVLLAAPVIALVYGASFAQAAPVLAWVGIGLIPGLSNSAQKILLYATGGEARVVMWSAVGLLIQIGAAALLIPMLGATGAAVGVVVSEVAIWMPLRRAAPARIDAGLHLEPETSA